MTLNIPESLLLLSRKDDTGAQQGNFVEYALAGGALAELFLAERMDVHPDKPKRINIISEAPLGDAYLDDCLAEIVKKGSGKSGEAYVTLLAGKSYLAATLAHTLVDRGILRAEEKSFLIFSWTNFPEVDSTAETAMKERLAAVMFDRAEPEVADCAIIALAQRTELLSKNFDKEELKANSRRIKGLAKGDFLPTKAAVKSIDAVQTALIVAAITPAIAASTTS